ncbi:MAG TPA: hypothetical protein VHY37_02880, partial [Tepidisphaeraceae bacterium]|nr:hypothetical protein [Tepidisphaeraceae bacterium]
MARIPQRVHQFDKIVGSSVIHLEVAQKGLQVFFDCLLRVETNRSIGAMNVRYKDPHGSLVIGCFCQQQVPLFIPLHAASFPHEPPRAGCYW